MDSSKETGPELVPYGKNPIRSRSLSACQCSACWCRGRGAKGNRVAALKSPSLRGSAFCARCLLLLYSTCRATSVSKEHGRDGVRISNRIPILCWISLVMRECLWIRDSGDFFNVSVSSSQNAGSEYRPHFAHKVPCPSLFRHLFHISTSLNADFRDPPARPSIGQFL